MPPTSVTTSAPTTSRLTMLAASLAAPLARVATWATALLFLALGTIKLVPGDGTVQPAAAALLQLSTGGVIDATWGVYLVGVLQLAIGIGLLLPAARTLTGLSCVLAALAVAVGMVVQWPHLHSGTSLNTTGVALLLLTVLLLAAAALATRDAAKQVGAAA